MQGTCVVLLNHENGFFAPLPFVVIPGFFGFAEIPLFIIRFHLNWLEIKNYENCHCRCVKEVRKRKGWPTGNKTLHPGTGKKYQVLLSGLKMAVILPVRIHT